MNTPAANYPTLDHRPGVIVADGYGAHMHCDAPEHRLPAATRKSMIVSFGMLAAQRMNRLIDPQGHSEIV